MLDLDTNDRSQTQLIEQLLYTANPLVVVIPLDDDNHLDRCLSQPQPHRARDNRGKGEHNLYNRNGCRWRHERNGTEQKEETNS